MAKEVRIGFDPNGVTLPVSSILPVRQLKPGVRATQKYQQILASVREVGVIEPLIVFPQDRKTEMYILLDGHLRLEVLKELGVKSARCLISTDDEGFTYNKRVSKLATIQEHAMVLNAITKGHISEERIARALNFDIASIRKKRDLLVGIGPEAAEVLKTRSISQRVFGFLRKMKPVRQLEVADLLVATNNFSVPYTKALLAATPAEMLVDPEKRKVIEGLTPEQIVRMEKEMDSLHRDLKLIEASHGNEVLNLVLARGYLAKLFGNPKVVRYLGQNYADILRELQAIVEATSLES
jgi:ParB-like chromosome segregation protein Spo0J